MFRKMLCGIAALACAGVASAGITVGDEKLAKPGDYLMDQYPLILEFSYDNNPDTPGKPPVTQSITVPNAYISENVKYFWMEVKMDTANGFPQEAGNEFDSVLWPTITGMTTEPPGVTHETTPSGASVFSGDNEWCWYLSVIIRPQPASETISFPGMWWDTWGDHITEVNVQTACIPTSGALALLTLGVGFATGRRR